MLLPRAEGVLRDDKGRGGYLLSKGGLAVCWIGRVNEAGRRQQVTRRFWAFSIDIFLGDNKV